MRNKFSLLFIVRFCLVTCFAAAQSEYQEGWVNSDGVGIHYVTKGKGPLILFLHGYPDYWMSWKPLMDQFSEGYQVVAIDLRGYNKSDKPEGVDNYRMSLLMLDVKRVIEHFSPKGAIIVANDWGGAIAWYFSYYYPSLVNGLVACNIPNPISLAAYSQKHPSIAAYTEKLKRTDAADHIKPADLVKEVALPGEEALYLEAFKRSSIEGMLNYYRANYRVPSKSTNTPNPNFKVHSPVLILHGLADPVFPPQMLDGTWNVVPGDLSIHTFPEVGHFIQKEIPKVLYPLIIDWIERVVLR